MEYYTQNPPELPNEFEQDEVLQSILRRFLSDDEYETISAKLRDLSEVSTGELWELFMSNREKEPELKRWDAWGNRVDEVREEPVWKRSREVALEYDIPSLPYRKPLGSKSRMVQMAEIYLFHPSSGVFTCPLAMTDGAARAIIESGNEELRSEVVPHLTSSQPEQFWMSGQWMTETTGGSDLSGTETIARKENGTWMLYGKKWFVSAVHSDVSLTLARPEGRDDELALFFIHPEKDRVPGENMRIDRLKDKLGTRKLPTGEVTLDGLPAVPVDGLSGGIKKISPLLNRTRLWNSSCALGDMNRILTLLDDYASKRSVFGRELREQPMFKRLFGDLKAELVGGLHLTLHTASLMGNVESGEESREVSVLARMLTSLSKLITGRQVLQVVSEALEGFGGSGYIEDTGIPRFIRDAQVYPIWEGPTNVLVLEFLQVLQKKDGWTVLKNEIQKQVDSIEEGSLHWIKKGVNERLTELGETFERFRDEPKQIEARGREIVFRISRLYQLALLGNHAQWERKNGRNSTVLEVAERLARGTKSLYPGR